IRNRTSGAMRGARIKLPLLYLFYCKLMFELVLFLNKWRIFMARRKRKKQGTVLSSVIVLIAIAWGLFTKAGGDPSGSQFLKDFTGNHDEQHVTNTIGDASKANKAYGGLSDVDYKKLANLNFKSGDKAFTVVNHNRS